MKKFSLLFVLITIFIPTISFAALGGIKNLISEIANIVNMLVPVMFGLSVLYFFWGLGQFILHASEEEAVKEGKRRMLWGVVALFVFVSIFGILKWIGGTIGINPGGLLNGNSSTLGPGPGDCGIDPSGDGCL